jgi:hypothetical protein
VKVKYAIPAVGATSIIIAVVVYVGNPPIVPFDSAQNFSSDTSQDGIMITDGLKHSVPLDKIKGGGSPRDGIPSIDDPIFAKASEEQFVSDSDIVIGLEINGEAKAYPLFILVWHEIVNDNVGGMPVSVTYCPLCFTNQVFHRVINDHSGIWNIR